MKGSTDTSALTQMLLPLLHLRTILFALKTLPLYSTLTVRALFFTQYAKQSSHSIHAKLKNHTVRALFYSCCFLMCLITGTGMSSGRNTSGTSYACACCVTARLVRGMCAALLEACSTLRCSASALPGNNKPMREKRVEGCYCLGFL